MNLADNLFIPEKSEQAFPGRIEIYFYCLIILLSLLFSPETTVAAEDVDPPGQFVHMGLQVMYIDCLGDDSPTVLIDVGLGDSSANWYRIAKQLSAEVKTCVYDRGGYGWSDPGPGARTTAQIAHELNMLLDLAAVPGPYVLVGHSFGGFTAQYFAARYPEKVAGAVLVDSSHPQQVTRLAALDKSGNQAALITTRQNSAPEDMNPFERRWFYLNSSRKAVFAQMDELKNFRESAGQVTKIGPMRDIPLAVLTRSKSQLPVIKGLSMEAEWQDMQKDLLNLSADSWQRIVPESGHNIYKDAPEIVISNIMQVVKKVRKRASGKKYHC